MHFLQVLVVLAVAVCFGNAEELPPYIKQCREDDPKLTDCITASIQHMAPWMANGIPEINAPSVEPFVIDELSLSLTTGPNGYKIVLRELEAFGASNYTVDRLKLSDGNKPFEARVKIPELKIRSNYSSSGVLIVLPASGGGELTGKFSDVTALVQGKVQSEMKDGKRYMKLTKLVIDLRPKHVQLQVHRIFNNNRILTEATNLFLRENGIEVIKAMGPQLNKKLAILFKNIVNKIVSRFPVSIFLIPSDQKV